MLKGQCFRKDLAKFVKIVYIGSKDQWAMKTVLNARRGMFKIDVNKLIVWLEALRDAGHPAYQDIVLPKTEKDREEAQADLDEQCEAIMNGASFGDDDRAGLLEKLTTDVAQARPNPEDPADVEGSKFKANAGVQHVLMHTVDAVTNPRARALSKIRETLKDSKATSPNDPSTESDSDSEDDQPQLV